MQASCSTLTLLSEMGQDKTDDGLQNILLCVSLTVCHCDLIHATEGKKTLNTLWKSCC